jgi:hypothetical protein
MSMEKADKIRRGFYWPGHKDARRTLAGGMGQSVQSHGVGRSGDFKPKRTGLGIKNEMALAEKKQTLLTHGQGCSSKSPTKLRPSSQYVCKRKLEMEPTPCFGVTDGYMDTE